MLIVKALIKTFWYYPGIILVKYNFSQQMSYVAVAHMAANLVTHFLPEILSSYVTLPTVAGQDFWFRYKFIGLKTSEATSENRIRNK